MVPLLTTPEELLKWLASTHKSESTLINSMLLETQLQLLEKDLLLDLPVWLLLLFSEPLLLELETKQ